MTAYVSMLLTCLALAYALGLGNKANIYIPAMQCPASDFLLVLQDMQLLAWPIMAYHIYLSEV